MAKSKFTTEQLEAIARIQEHNGVSRKSAVRKFQKQLRADSRANRKAAAKAPKQPKAKVSKPTTDAGKARSAGVQDFILAGRPTKEQFILVYGERGPKMTWEQRAAAGVPAEKFQAVLAEKGGSRPSKAAGRKKAARPARTTKKSARTPEATANVLDQIPATLNTGN